jgi:hypothetical protein
MRRFLLGPFICATPAKPHQITNAPAVRIIAYVDEIGQLPGQFRGGPSNRLIENRKTTWSTNLQTGRRHRLRMEFGSRFGERLWNWTQTPRWCRRRFNNTSCVRVPSQVEVTELHCLVNCIKPKVLLGHKEKSVFMQPVVAAIRQEHIL